ncbi:hypothetical protein ACOM2C_01150 [Pseudarthrobacter sp. So.54]
MLAVVEAGFIDFAVEPHAREAAQNGAAEGDDDGGDQYEDAAGA